MVGGQIEMKIGDRNGLRLRHFVRHSAYMKAEVECAVSLYMKVKVFISLAFLIHRDFS